MKSKKAKLTIIGVAILLCCGVSQSAEVKIGCGIIENIDSKGVSHRPYVDYYSSIGEFNQDDFSDEGFLTVSITISGNDKSWTFNGQGKYEKNGNIINMDNFMSNRYIPSLTYEELKEEFGIFMNVDCKLIY